MVDIKENIELSQFTTFKIGGPARYFLIAKDEDDLRESFAFAKTRKLPIFVLGGGSNLLVSDQGFNGLVIKNEIKGFKFIDKDQDKVIFEVGAGEIWDEIVALSVARNLSGLENLSGIPGTVGGAAVQNAGAYGTEIKDCLISVSGLNIVNGKSFEFNLKDCQYGYRDSVFKANKKLVITRVVFELSKKSNLNISYASLKARLVDEKDLTLGKIRDEVLKIRSEKLPDWRKMGTAGSFFKNPVIDLDKYEKLKTEYPEIPGFPEKNNKIKIPLAWILDHVCNLKNYKEGKVGLYEKQPLVLVSSAGALEKEVVKISKTVKEKVFEKTGIEIEEEVEKI